MAKTKSIAFILFQVIVFLDIFGKFKMCFFLADLVHSTAIVKKTISDISNIDEEIKVNQKQIE